MILFFYGPNTYAARQQLSRLTDEYVRKTGSDLGLERIDGRLVKPDSLQASLQAAPFLANSRLVIVEDLSANKGVAAKIDDYIKNIPESTVAIFYDPSVDQRTAYFKKLKENSKAVKFDPLDPVKLQQWVARIAQEHGAEIERPAIARLLELAGEDQWRLSNEIAKLSTYRNPITQESVDEQVEESQSESVFSLVEAMTSGNIGRALELYRQLRSAGQNEMYLLSMIIWQLRNLLIAKAAGKVTSAELSKQAGMSPYVAGKMLSKRNGFTEDQLKSTFIEAVDTDYRIKSGAGSADALVEQLVYKVAGSSAQR